MTEKRKVKVEQLEPGFIKYTPIDPRSSVVLAVSEYLRPNGRRKHKASSRRRPVRPGNETERLF